MKSGRTAAVQQMAAPLSPRRRVRVWFGQYQVSEYIGEPAYANRYEAAMRRRLPGLEITNVPLETAGGPASDASRALFSA